MQELFRKAKLLSTAINISKNSLQKNLEYLASNELRGRETGTEGIEKAASFIEKSFTKSGLQPYFETYRDSFEVKGKVGYNIIGYIEGTDKELKDEFIILGAHYDHVGLGKVVNGDSIANGANDNAAGTVAVMGLAEYFGKKKINKRSLLFVLFSAEEMGLVGAKYAAANLKEKGLDLYAMVNLEMIGVPMQGKNFAAYLTGFENSNMAQKFNEYSNAEVLGYLPEAKQYNLFKRSDNYPFYEEFKVPAQTISTFDFTNYEFYHHVSDQSEKMDFAHMASLVEKIIPALTKMANTPEKEIKLNK
ncbi:M20/M25/M40 family metallo-hydrolase [Antarcticibacterium sp. 1MA-6-2]|uniref:M20/M25/M40 family metallo-hydrolase n=1 Tax=Antarcticibacterium sp. 1MA-6-2 TaxID=2908210 RepID=UPI001F1EC695|nr:M20/M25/M40 family metallo-hydrolase [Antarcticibacterium sp. 1MA-6-2]UJH89778.1 M20/M25/M40 family metallo-hydrolase [Antarcticibacterium sp. 1MA-6-2]